MINKSIPAKVMSGRRITLPEDWCEQENIKEGNLVLIQFIKDSQSITVIPAEIKPRAKA